jgi:hypothetical protein
LEPTTCAACGKPVPPRAGACPACGAAPGTSASPFTLAPDPREVPRASPPAAAVARPASGRPSSGRPGPLRQDPAVPPPAPNDSFEPDLQLLEEDLGRAPEPAAEPPRDDEPVLEMPDEIGEAPPGDTLRMSLADATHAWLEDSRSGEEPDAAATSPVARPRTWLLVLFGALLAVAALLFFLVG